MSDNPEYWLSPDELRLAEPLFAKARALGRNDATVGEIVAFWQQLAEVVAAHPAACLPAVREMCNNHQCYQTHKKGPFCEEIRRASGSVLAAVHPVVVKLGLHGSKLVFEQWDQRWPR